MHILDLHHTYIHAWMYTDVPYSMEGDDTIDDFFNYIAGGDLDKP